MTDKDIMKLIDETQQLGAARGWDMRVKLIYLVERTARAATKVERERMEKHCSELSQGAYNKWRANGNPYDDGQCDAANALGEKIRSGE